ncbi:MAG: hypothetical protein GY794_26240, partial [bacterium]|nr:hypothetical protein [bacterium]
MSKCDIVIEFDRADRTYYTGGIISGTVYITPQANTKCNGIRIELGWATHGRGNKDTETLDSIDHDGMQFVAGKTMACKFRFGAPSAPLTYHGHHLDINHYLAIRLDVPWAIDPKAREQYILLPGDTCESPDETYGIRKIRDTKNANGCVLAVVMIIAIVSLFIGFFPVIIGAWILAMVLGFKVFRNSIAASQLGEVAFTLARRRATPGERLPVSVEFSPTRQISINQISAVLKGVEKVSSGSGKNRKTHTETICEQHCILCEATQLSIGKQVLSSEILIPQTNAWTFHAKNNKLIWTVTLRVDIPNWPDWVTSTEFGLIPASGSQIKQQREKPTPRPTPPPIEPPPVTPPPVAIAVETPDPVPPDPTEPKAQPVVQDNSASDAA